MKLIKEKSAIILPLKESFSFKNFGAVSIWVNDYINKSKISNDLVFCRKLSKSLKYLNSNVHPVSIKGNFLQIQII